MIQLQTEVLKRPFRNWPPPAVRWPAAERQAQVLLGKLTARNHKKNVGDTFRINEIGYRVVGIYETGMSFEDNGAVISRADAQRAFDKRGQMTYVEVKFDDPRRSDDVRQAIEKRWDDLTTVRSGEPAKQDAMLAIYNSLG